MAKLLEYKVTFDLSDDKTRAKLVKYITDHLNGSYESDSSYQISSNLTPREIMVALSNQVRGNFNSTKNKPKGKPNKLVLTPDKVEYCLHSDEKGDKLAMRTCKKEDCYP